MISLLIKQINIVLSFFLTYKVIIIFVFYLFLIFQLFNNDTVSDINYLLVLLIWIVYILIYRFHSILSLINASVSLGLAYLINLFFINDILVEKFASFFFIFLLIFLIQKLFFERNTPRVLR